MKTSQSLRSRTSPNTLHHCCITVVSISLYIFTYLYTGITTNKQCTTINSQKLPNQPLLLCKNYTVNKKQPTCRNRVPWNFLQNGSVLHIVCLQHICNRKRKRKKGRGLQKCTFLGLPYLQRSTRLMKTCKSRGTEGWTPATGSEVGAPSSGGLTSGEGLASGGLASWSEVNCTLKMPYTNRYTSYCTCRWSVFYSLRAKYNCIIYSGNQRFLQCCRCSFLIWCSPPEEQWLRQAQSPVC